MTSRKERARVAQAAWPDYLRRFRQKHGLTQKNLADLLQISLRCVEQWETGLRTPPSFLRRALGELHQQLEDTIG